MYKLGHLIREIGCSNMMKWAYSCVHCLNKGTPYGPNYNLTMGITKRTYNDLYERAHTYSSAAAAANACWNCYQIGRVNFIMLNLLLNKLGVKIWA